MVNLTIDEITLNATRAALDERVKRLAAHVVFLETRFDRPLSEDAQRALVWNVAALHETRMAVEFYAEVEPEQADPVTTAKAYAELGYHDAQIAGPR